MDIRMHREPQACPLRLDNAIYQGLGYSERTSNCCRFQSCTERGSNQICFPLRRFLDYAAVSRRGLTDLSRAFGTALCLALSTTLNLNCDGLSKRLQFRIVQVLERG